MAILAYAGTASSYAFSAASSYMYRTDASTSAKPVIAEAKPAPSPPTSLHRRSSTRSAPTLPTSSSTPAGRKKPTNEGEDLCETINELDDLYAILGVRKKAATDEIRRAFLSRSRIIHPDKLPHYPPSTPAFQRLSYAYETLSKPSSRRLYDLGGLRGCSAASREGGVPVGDETLHGVLRNVFNEFMSGDFETIRVFLNAFNESNPGVNIGEETVDNIEGVFRRVREVILTGQKYLRIIKFELIRLYEIQHSLRSLSYFDVVGRLRLTLALTRVTLEIPMVLDRAMRDEPSPSSVPTKRPREGSDSSQEAEEGESRAGELQRRGLLGNRVKGVLVVACKVLEKGERLGM